MLCGCLGRNYPGKAGGLEIRVDGVPIPPIGPVGTVRRQIALDPARLLSGAAVPR